jgi:hypothetical protein
MRGKHCEPGNHLRWNIASFLTGAGHLCNAKTAQLELAERFIGTDLPKPEVARNDVRRKE